MHLKKKLSQLFKNYYSIKLISKDYDASLFKTILFITHNLDFFQKCEI